MLITRSELFRKAHRLLTVVEHYDVFRLRKRSGIFPDLFILLNKAWFLNAGISTIIDIGANNGNWARTMNLLLPKSRIYSFEPLPECFQKLEQQMQNIKNHKSFNFALGDISGKVEFNQNEFSASSSIHDISAEHVAAFPFTAKAKKIMVNIDRLDNIIAGYNLDREVLVKIDVQGYEDKVIAGATETLLQAKIVIVEVSYEVLYKGQPLFEHLFEQLSRLGFRYHGNLEQMISPIDGNIIQADAVFIRK